MGDVMQDLHAQLAANKRQLERARAEIERLVKTESEICEALKLRATETMAEGARRIAAEIVEARKDTLTTREARVIYRRVQDCASIPAPSELPVIDTAMSKLNRIGYLRDDPTPTEHGTKP